jgi:hypothetical protein
MTEFAVTARLDSQQRRKVREMLASINISLPVDENLTEREQRNDPNSQLRRALGALAGGDHCSQATFERGMAAAQEQINACEMESSAQHWLAQLPADQRSADPSVPTSPTHMCHTLAKARAQQAEQAHQVFDMLSEIAIELDSASRRLPQSEDQLTPA